MNITQRIDRARWWSLTEQPFYGSLAMSLADVIDKSVPTTATDGKVIRWNPDYLEKRTDEEVRFLLLHETLHCAHMHLWRLPLSQRGNMAGDYEINLTLQNISGIKMPEDGLLDHQYDNMACEEILGTLPDDEESGDGDGDQGDEDGESQQQSGGGGQQPDGGQSGDGHGHCGCWTEPASDSQSGESTAQAQQQLRDAWEGNVIQAAQAAQAMGIGDLPADLQRILDKVNHQPIDWRREMADFVRDAMSTRNDWSRSARRHAWQPVIYPRRMVDSIGTVIFARDTSGSVSDKIAAEYSALITDAVGEMGCRGIVIDCDAHIQAEYEVNAWEECPLRAKGGGGTEFQPVFDRAEELIAEGESIAGIVYLTDLQCRQMPEPCDIPVLWLATMDGTMPFGRVVRIEV